MLVNTVGVVWYNQDVCCVPAAVGGERKGSRPGEWEHQWLRVLGGAGGGRPLRQRPRQGQKEEESLRHLPQESWPHRYLYYFLIRNNLDTLSF